MKFYVASSISNKAAVQHAFASLRSAGHEVTTDWTLTDDVPEAEREAKRDYVRSVVKRDFEGILEADVFLLLSEPSEGRSMYVELGIAIAMYDVARRPLVFVVGPRTNHAAFYFHPSVQRVNSIDEVFERVGRSDLGETSRRGHEGRLEEYRSLRSEMLDIMRDRTWGQATYAALATGLLALSPAAYRVPSLVFTMGLAIPFLYHTIQREQARIRMGNYLRVVVEPLIPGMYWEEYLGQSRAGLGQESGKGWLDPVHRTRHILAFAGVYLLISGFCLVLVLGTADDLLPTVAAWIFFLVLLASYAFFFRVYERGEKDYEQLWRLGPRG